MADVEAIRARLAGLSPEQRAGLDDILSSELVGQRATPSAGQMYRPESSGNVWADSAIGGMGAPSASSLEEAGENLATGAGIMATGPGVGGAVSGLAGAASRGLGPAAGAIGNLVARGAVGAGAGALVGSLPFVGSSPTEGAKLGALMAAGQGGTGALWKHGKRKAMIEWLMGKAGVEPIKKGAAAAARNIPAEVEAATKAAKVSQAVGPKGTRAMATNLGGKAKPGPPPTQPGDIEAALQASLKSGGGMHQRAATAGMTEKVAAGRKAVGSEKVARELGMARQQVQSDAGVITDEALGEVSKLIPEKPWADIVTKMRAMPPSERFAYVAKARGAKNYAQIEQLRRSLEAMGLLVPAGVAANELGGGDGW